MARAYAGPALAATGGLVAVCDPVKAARDAVCSEDAGVFRTDDVGALLAHPDVEAVYVATPNDLHADVVARAAAAGKAVLCEKPMARTAEEAEAMLRACDAAGVLYATAFDQRFHPAHEAMRDLIAGGALGAVTSVSIRYACWTGDDWRPDALYTDNWRTDPQRAGGGAFIDLAPHGLDLTQMLLGEPLVDVTARFQRRVHGYAVDDGAALVGVSASGVLLAHSVAYNCPETFERRRLEVVGTRGRLLSIDTMGQTPGGTLAFTDAATGETRAVPFDALASPFARGVAAFARAVRGAPWPFPGAADVHTMRLLDRAAASAEVAAEAHAAPEPAAP